jgi:DNA-binding MarR family transcriptional regulator
LIGPLSWANFIRVSQKLAAQLGLAPSNVSAAIKRLIRLGLNAKQPDPDADSCDPQGDVDGARAA